MDPSAYVCKIVVYLFVWVVRRYLHLSLGFPRFKFRITKRSLFDFSPRRYNEIRRRVQARGLRNKVFFLSLGSDRPFRAFRLVRRGNSRDGARVLPHRALLNLRASTIRCLLCAIGVTLQHDRVLNRLLFGHNEDPLGNNIRLPSFRSASQGSLAQIACAFFTSLREPSSFFHQVLISSFKRNGEAFRERVPLSYRPSVDNMPNTFFLGDFHTMDAVPLTRFRRNKEDVFFRFMYSTLQAVIDHFVLVNQCTRVAYPPIEVVRWGALFYVFGLIPTRQMFR